MTKRSASMLLLLGLVVTGGAMASEQAESNWQGPVLIPESRVAPTYPPAALNAKLEGVVTVSAHVLADGSVDTVEVVEATATNLGFESAASKAVEQWQFEPATADGAPTDAYQVVRLHFVAGPSRMNPGYVAASFAVPSAAPPIGIGTSRGTSTQVPGTVQRTGARSRAHAPKMRVPRCGGLLCAYRTSDIYTDSRSTVGHR